MFMIGRIREHESYNCHPELVEGSLTIGSLGATREKMSQALLNLVVIRSLDIDGLCHFYSAFGMEFTKHAHGKGPEHYSAESNGVVLEIYPQIATEDSTTGVRLGFRVTSIDDLLSRLELVGGKVLSPAKDSPWGRRAVVVDPSGHKVELIEQQTSS